MQESHRQALKQSRLTRSHVDVERLELEQIEKVTIHHLFSFQLSNFALVQILPSIDIWHPFRLVLWISGFARVFSHFSFFQF